MISRIYATAVKNLLTCFFLLITGILSAFTLPYKQEVKIIVPKHAPTSVQYAAQELSHYIHLCTGSKGIITHESDDGKGIFLAAKTANDLNEDGYVIEAGAFRIDIYGNDSDEKSAEPISMYFYTRSKGTLLGVYHFLREYCGIRWIAPGEIGEVIPPQKKINIPSVKLREEPAFRQRFCFNMYLTRNDRYPDQNVYLERGNGDFSRSLLKWGMRLGFSSQAYPVLGAHSVSRFKLKQAFCDKHPEWFALQKDGSRGGPYGALCWSNPDIKKLWCQLADAFFCGRTPDTVGLPMKTWPYPFCILPDEFMIDPVDEYSRYHCQCEKCRDKDLNNVFYSVIAEVAEEMKGKHPGKFITTLAYPPKSCVPPLSFPHNVRVRLCLPGPVEKVADPDGHKVYMKLLKDWNSKLNHTVPVWFYLVNSFHGLYGPMETSPADFRNYVQDIRPFTEHLFYEFDTLNQTYHNYDLYMQAKIMWNPGLDLEREKKDYFEHAYGKAAPDIQGFYSRLEDLWQRIQKGDYWDSGNRKLPILMGGWKKNAIKTVYKEIYTDLEISNLEAMLQKAQQKVKRGSIYDRRIQILREWIINTVRNLHQVQTQSEMLRHSSTMNINVLADVPTEKNWEAAPWYSLSPLVRLPIKLELKEKGYFKILASQDKIFIKAKLLDSEIKQSRTVPNRSGSALKDIWKDNTVEFFFYDGQKIRQFLFNDLGNYAATEIENGIVKYINVPQLSVNAVRTENGWTLDAVIPMVLTGFNPKVKGDYRFNVLRERNAGKQPTEVSAWVPHMQSTMVMNPDIYGTFLFSDNKVDNVKYEGIATPASHRKMSKIATFEFAVENVTPWRQWKAPKKAPQQFWLAAEGHTGKGCLVTKSKAGQQGAWLTFVTVTPGQRIRVSAFVKNTVPNSKTSVLCDWKDKNNKYVAYDKFAGGASVSASGKWEEVAFELQVPKIDKIDKVQIVVSASAPSELYIDDVVIFADDGI